MPRPQLWLTAVVEAARLARSRWWRHWPPLPLPDRRYLGFRLDTAYGSGSSGPESSEVAEYLRWCRRMRRMSR